MFSVSSYKWLRCWSLLIETWAIRKELSYWEFKMLTGNSRFFIYFFFFSFWMNIWENIAFEAALQMNQSQRHPSGWKLPASKWCTDSAREENQRSATNRFFLRLSETPIKFAPRCVCGHGPHRRASRKSPAESVSMAQRGPVQPGHLTTRDSVRIYSELHKYIYIMFNCETLML